MKRLLQTFFVWLLVLSLAFVGSGYAAEKDDKKLTVTFFDVGEGDAALISLGSHHMIIDGGSASQSQLMYTVLKNRGIDHLDYIICSHPHEDHVGGLAGALNYATADVGMCPVRSYDSKAFASFKKYLKKNITVPAAGDTYPFGDALLTVLGPVTATEKLNNRSLVIRLDYGDTSFLLTGDMELDEEQSLLDAGVIEPATVLKVAHHGSDTSTSYRFLREVMPKFAIISVGQDNTYGHPHDKVLSRLSDADVQVFRTDQHGDITAVSDGKDVVITTEKDPGVQQLSALEDLGIGGDRGPAGYDYVLNKNTKKFHVPDCPSVDQMKEKNKVYFSGTREEAIDQGYVPCKNCHP